MKKKKLFSLVLATVLTAATVLPCYGASTKEKISNAQAEQAAAQSQLDSIQSRIDELNSKKGQSEEYLSELNQQLDDLQNRLQELQDQYDAKQNELVQIQADLEDAKAKEEEQYEAMKLRIQYMYEKGDYSYLELLLECKNMSDLVSKSEYVEELYEYDRKMLIKYQEARQLVEDTKEKLLMEQEELEVSKHELDEEKAGLDELLEEKKAEASDYDAEIAKVKQAATLFKAKIKQQNAQIKKLEEEEAKKAAEEAAKASAGKSNSSNVDSSSIISGASGSAKGKDIANFACRYVGNPYVAGGTSLTNGADCSGFTFAVYKEFGISLPRTSTSQRSAGREVSLSDAQPGDIVCYAGHVAIYIGGGRIVHASTPSTGIKYGNVNYKPVITVRRIVD